MVESYIFYTVLSLIVLILSYFAGKTKNTIYPIILVLILSFIAGFRAYSVGSDTEEYVKIFNNINNGQHFEKDLGFSYISGALLKICNNPTFLFFIYAIVIYSLITARLWDLKSESSFTISFFTFYSFHFFESMNGMRQFVAVAFVFFGTRYLAKRKYIPFIIFVVLGALFHFSAMLGLLCLFIEFLSWKSLSKRQKHFLIGVTVLGLICAVLFSATLFGLIEKYIHYFDTINFNFGLRVIALLIIFLLSLFFYHTPKNAKFKLLTRQDSAYTLFTIRAYYLLACALGSFGYFYPFMERLGWYFAPYFGVYFGMFIKEKDKSNKIVLLMSVVFIVGYILFNYIFVLNGSNHHPYKFVWD